MKAVRLYNSLTKRLEILKPNTKGVARVYSCGPTVYKRQHLGNLRRYLFADFLHRALELLGYQVKEVMNITDVGHLTEDDVDAGEDKVEKEARTRKVSPQAVTDEQTSLFFADLEKLNVKTDVTYPRASRHIKSMQRLISRLLERGHAYRTASGVYFDVRSFSAYGRLSGNRPEDLIAGKRVAAQGDKKHPADFALWIRDENHLQKWDSPWGRGYPGWHIECSAMSLKYLGTDIDIHTGGEDNRFPHHENEIAQSEGATGEKFVRLWLHNRHLQMSGKKLAKREGGQITLDTLIAKGYSPLAFRLLVFASHYRSKIDFSWEMMEEAQKNLETLKQLWRRLRLGGVPAGPENAPAADQEVIDSFSNALADDLNTPRASAVLWEYVRGVENRPRQQALATLAAADEVVGVLEPLRRQIEAETVPDDVRKLAARREQERKNGHYEEADRLRQVVEEKGYKIEDTGTGPRIVKL